MTFIASVARDDAPSKRCAGVHRRLGSGIPQLTEEGNPDGLRGLDGTERLRRQRVVSSILTALLTAYALSHGKKTTYRSFVTDESVQ
jgi:hypothetical protein